MRTKKKETNLIICNSYPTDKNPTAQIFIKNIKNQLESKGIYSCVYYNKIIDIWPEATSYKSITANIIKYSVFILGLIPLFIRIRQFKTINPHGILISGFVGAIIKIIFKKKLITHIHGGDVNQFSKKNSIYKFLYFITLKYSDIIISNSDDINDKLIQIQPIEKKMVKIYPGVDNRLFHKHDLRIKKRSKEKYKIPKNRIIFLFVGNAIKRKGLDLFYDAINKLNDKEIKKIHVIICSDGPELGKIKNSVLNDLRLKKIFTFLKKVNQKNLPEIYALGDVFVFPSREEPLGLVGIEALTCGLPVIGTEIGGIKDYLVDNFNGLLFEPQNSNQLAEKISALINDPDHLEYLKTNTKKDLNKFYIDHTSIQLKNIFSNF